MENKDIINNIIEEFVNKGIFKDVNITNLDKIKICEITARIIGDEDNNNENIKDVFNNIDLLEYEQISGNVFIFSFDFNDADKVMQELKSKFLGGLL